MFDGRMSGSPPPVRCGLAGSTCSVPIVPVPDPPLLFGRYRLEERLGVGGTAEVWRAQDELLDRPVALKRLHPFLVPDERARERFASEAHAVAGLEHPGIVGVHDVHAEDEGVAIALELLDGESLDDRLARAGALDADEAAAIAADVADALAYAHAQGIVHRDVKPGNIIVGSDGRARLLDFGIAKALDDAGAAPTVTGTVMGTLRYMAPEQLRGEPVGPATDVFGLGAVLHQLLTGEPAFPVSNPAALIDAHRSGPAAIAVAPPALAALVHDALSPDPAARPTAAELATALRTGSLDETDTQPIAVPLPAGPIGAAPIAAATGARLSSPPDAQPARRPSRFALVVGAGTLALVLAAAALGGGDDPAASQASQAAQQSPGPEAVSPEPTPEPAAEEPNGGGAGKDSGKGKGGGGKGKGKGGG